MPKSKSGSSIPCKLATSIVSKISKEAAYSIQLRIVYTVLFDTSVCQVIFSVRHLRSAVLLDGAHTLTNNVIMADWYDLNLNMLDLLV